MGAAVRSPRRAAAGGGSGRGNGGDGGQRVDRDDGTDATGLDADEEGLSAARQQQLSQENRIRLRQKAIVSRVS